MIVLDMVSAIWLRMVHSTRFFSWISAMDALWMRRLSEITGPVAPLEAGSDPELTGLT